MSACADMPAVQSVPTSLGLRARVAAVFFRPARAWDGLEMRPQAWFPLLISALFAMTSTALLYNRAMLPMLMQRWERDVTAQSMTPEHAAELVDVYTRPEVRAFMIGNQLASVVGTTLLTSALLWLVTRVLLRIRLRYRVAFAIVAWSGLILLPTQVTLFAMAWLGETYRGVHAGFGALITEPETPSRVLSGIGMALDAISPLSLWYLVVGILGVSAITGVSRRRASLALVTTYVVATLAWAGVSAAFGSKSW